MYCTFVSTFILLSLPYLVQVVPECPKCREELTKAALDDPESEEEEVFAVMKPDIVFFGEQLPEEFHEWLQEDLSQVSSGSVLSSDSACQVGLWIAFAKHTLVGGSCSKQPAPYCTAPCP